VIAVVKKHYDALLKCFPEDINVTSQRLRSYAQQLDPMSNYQYSPLNAHLANETMLNLLINQLLSSNSSKAPIIFCSALILITGDSNVIRELIKG